MEKSVLIREPRGVDLGSIERELATLWKEASERSDATGSPPVTRACAMNLIVVVDNEAWAEEIGEMVGEVSVVHPARIFRLLIRRQQAVPELDAWVSARCSLPRPGYSQVCCEEIVVTARGSATATLPSIVSSLMVSDIPSVLFWKASILPDDRLLGNLLEVADRVLIDSSDVSDPEELLAVWAALIRSASGKPGEPGDRVPQSAALFGDLSWTHVTPWRTVLANVFQPAEMRASLAALNRVHLTYSSTDSPPHSGRAQAYLLIAWLGSRLRWEVEQELKLDPSGASRARFKASLSGNPVEVGVVQSGPARSMPGGLESVSLSAGAHFSISLSQTERRECVRLQRKVNGRVEEEYFRYPMSQNESALLARELEILHNDETYERTMAVLHRLLVGIHR